MTLLLQVAGVLFVAALAPIVLRGDRHMTDLPSGVALVAVAAAGISFWSSFWPQTDSLLDQSEDNAHRTRAAIEGGPGVQFGAREGFLAWADRRLPPGATVYFECKGDSACGGGGLPQWVTFRLIPRRFVERRDDAEWVLVNGASSAVERESRLASSPYERFGRGFGLGRLRR